MSNKNHCTKAEPPSGRPAIIQLKNDVLTDQLNGIDVIKRDSCLYDLESAVWGIELSHYPFDVCVSHKVVPVKRLIHIPADPLIVPGSRNHTTASMPRLSPQVLLVGCLDTTVDDGLRGSFVGESPYHREHTYVTAFTGSDNSCNIGRSDVSSHCYVSGHCHHDLIRQR